MKLGTHNGYPLEIDSADLFQHCYIIGQTGTGKSTLIRNAIANALQDGEGLTLIDPHGDLSDSVVLDIPRGRDDDLIYLKPSHLPAAVSFNPLFDIQKDDRATVAGNVVGAFVSTFGEHAVADRSQQVLRNSLLALMDSPAPTLLSVIRLLTDPDFRARAIGSVKDPLVRNYWTSQFDLYDDRFREQVIAPILNKLDALFSYPAIRHVLAQPNGSVNLRRVIEGRKILILNLSGLADGADYVLGALVISALWSAAQSANRTPHYLYIDEFQNFATSSLLAILSEARKYKLSLTLAHQFWGQVPEDIKDAVFGNVGTLVAFRTGAIDAPLLAKQFDLAERQIRDLPNYIAYVRPLPPASSGLIDTYPPPARIRRSPDQLIANSLSHFAAPREDVERHINRMFAD